MITKYYIINSENFKHADICNQEHMGVSSKTGNKLSVSQMSAVLTHHHPSGHNFSDFDITILMSGNSKFDLEMRESLLISKLKPVLNNNISSMPPILFQSLILNLTWYFDIPVTGNIQ